MVVMDDEFGNGRLVNVAGLWLDVSWWFLVLGWLVYFGSIHGDTLLMTF
jgi:hypothetical protein